MSIDLDLGFTADELAAQRRLNRRLARLPRFGVTGPVRLALLRALLRLGDIGADRRVRRRGLAVSALRVEHRGHVLRFRVIRPPGRVRGLVFDIHGGAWALGSPAMDDGANAVTAREAGAIVLALDYGLALPRSILELQTECRVALDWLLTRADGEFATLPVVVTGESAGAHLLLGALVAVRDAGVPLGRVRGMLLHCGAYDLGGSASARAAGADTLVLHGPTLTRQIEALLPGLDEPARRAPTLSPLYADLSGLPPALILVGDIDPLRDDSIGLAGALPQAGGDARLEILPHAPHGVIHLPGPYATRVRRAAARWIDARLASG